MWGGGAVSEEDRLDRDEARRLLTRVGHMLRPYKGPVIIAGLLIVVWTVTVVAGPLIVRYAIDNGLSEGEVGPLNTAIVAYLAVAVVAYVVARLQIMSIGRIGEGFLRDLRVRVFDHLQSLSLGFFEKEKAGVLVSRMTSDIDSMAELVQFGLLQFVSNGLLLALTLRAAARALVAAHPRVHGGCPDRRGGVGEVPARLEQGVPHHPRPHRPQPVDAARGHHRRPGHPSVRS